MVIRCYLGKINASGGKVGGAEAEDYSAVEAAAWVLSYLSKASA